ncbi:MAG: Zn-ribbon domain-containing OB-fold protein [Thermoplasmata archaeon]
MKAAAYRPAGGRDGRSSSGPDEDGFTLAATALERLLTPDGSLGLVERLLLAGDLPASADADLARFIGASVPAERFGAGSSGVRAALGAAAETGPAGEDVLLIAVDLEADRTGRPLRARGSLGDAAVAVRFSEAEGAIALTVPDDDPEDGDEATAPLLRLCAEQRVDGANRWAVDGAAERATGSTLAEPGPRPTLRDQGPVSQGAYVPWSRYLDNLPSRWWFAADRCRSCGGLTFPMRGRCRHCGERQGLATVRLPRDGGKVVAATTIGPGGQPTEFDEQVTATGPYQVVLVELAKEVRVTLQVADAFAGHLPLGARVGTRLRRLYPMEGEWRYGRKAVPLL